MVTPSVTAHTFRASGDGPRGCANLLCLCRWNPKRKVGGNHTFSKIIELQWKENAIHCVMYLKLKVLECPVA